MGCTNSTAAADTRPAPRHEPPATAAIATSAQGNRDTFGGIVAYAWQQGPRQGATPREERYADGSRYVGEVSVVQDAGRSRLVKHGFGTYTWPDRSSYRGQWHMNDMHGAGVFEWPDGRSFAGAFVQDRFQGYGRFTYNDGSYFEGLFLNDLIYGIGFYGGAGNAREVEVDLPAVDPLFAQMVVQGARNNASGGGVGGVEGDAWLCTACGFRSGGAAPVCDACGTLRPGADPSALSGQPSQLSRADSEGYGAPCISCRAAPRVRAVVPCGHLIFCDACARGSSSLPGCPVCRSRMTAVIRLYMMPERRDESTHLCVVCLDAPRTHALVPCGHMCLCEACTTTPVGKKCPICRDKARRTLSVLADL